ncbi:MAG: hypothetical protein HYY15_03045 [Candidatus Omnitrophica bacterium]|nr:hypothetical protein [Candidatus Omnitrophota bacterium]
MIPPPLTSPMPNQSAQPAAKYLPKHCRFFDREAWAILIKPANGDWKIVNCLDKHAPCFERRCVFTRNGGGWPFDD